MTGPTREGGLRRGWHRASSAFDLRDATARTIASGPAVVQIVLAVVGAYAITHYGLGHAIPLLAVTITISSLGLARDARPRRVLENAVGVLIGIALSEVLLMVVGKGLWQIALVLFVTLSVARFFSPSSAFAAAAATQSMLVMLLPDPDGGAFVRSIDGAVGGAVALLVTAIVPRDPVGLARHDARRLFDEVDRAFASLVSALRTDDAPRADDALERLRSTQPVLDDWSSTLESAQSIARLSPFLRSRLPDLVQQAAVRRYVDLAVRNLRVVARRLDTQLGDGVDRSALADLLDSTARAVAVLGRSVHDVEQRPVAREALSAVARRLDPTVVLPGAPVTEAMVVLMMRPLLVDLLMATGLDHDDARARLARV
ncbi:FUSC family protein [Frigoribacterium sp. VKM Ac-2836]|uniref:FUSC family protein n=1 Tax=Frigoribacterium sp. VKM Ac-2836 TaxID=2739014 RepID=UPI001564D78B|nr:FUSC family protein [Frigoribacterium sp. VKM Ac-2836]